MMTTNISHVTDDDSEVIGDDHFMMAFSVKSKVTREPKSDPRYIRWIVRFYELLDDEVIDTWKELHPCTLEELQKFDPPDNYGTVKEIQSLQSGGHLFCLDWQSDP